MRGVCCVYALKVCCFPSCCRAAPSWIAWYAVRVLSVDRLGVLCGSAGRGCPLPLVRWVMVRPGAWVLVRGCKNIYANM